jgi:primosomal protein N' (replication factor Y) (superfamily II helicase)
MSGETASPPNGRPVQVALNRPVWNTFTYLMPPELEGGDLTGCRVIVPLGKDRVVGYVWPEDPPEDALRSGRLKPVLERLDPSPLLPHELLGMVAWAAAYYLAPPGMMMAAAHPPGISGRAVRWIIPAGSLEQESPLHGLIEPGKPIEAGALMNMLDSGVDLDALLSELETKGLLSTAWRPSSGPAPLMEVAVEAVRSDGLVRVADAIRSRAPRQAEILFRLSQCEGPVPRAELLRSTGATLSSVAALVEKGLIREFSRRRFRDSVAWMGSMEPDVPPVLSRSQDAALAKIREGGPGVYLLHGVTGSGKTEVYLRAIADVLARGGSALVLVPEISLTPLTVSRFSRRFPELVTVLHSGMSAGERLDSWNLAGSGDRRIAIGPRSAVFAPLRDLGIIVVDEEHDGSYKQDVIPRYNGRDLAVVRGSRLGIPVVLGSASPSMESFGNAVAGRYSLVVLPERIDSVPMPATVIVGYSEMKHPLLSDRLLAGIGKRTAKGEQCILLINRRGYSPVQLCRNCGFREECPDCGIAMTYHRKGQALRCHYCGRWLPAMVRCPRCGFDEFSNLGPGIQKVEEALKEFLPMTRVIRMDSDTTQGRHSHWHILRSFAEGGGDVLLGTQMVAKGHDFPNVTLVGIIAADLGLAFPDFRAAERTFQLILQVAGRAGRGGIQGEVILQTSDPSDATMVAAAGHDFAAFWKTESTVREAFGYPPYGHLVRFVWSGLDQAAVPAVAAKCMAGLEAGDVTLSPVQEAAFPRISRRWRWSSLARSTSRRELAVLAREVLGRMESITPKRGVRLEVDVDPNNLL